MDQLKGEKAGGRTAGLQEYRKKLDRIDAEILRLFTERMDTAGKIAGWKKENSLPVLDLRREREKLRAARKLARKDRDLER